MKNKKNIGWIILIIGVGAYLFNTFKKKGTVIVSPLDPGEYPTNGGNFFPSDIPDIQD